jgi:primosomal protein N' (replication factor Y)
VVVGTRGALLAPLPPPATLVLLDEHEAAHKPPGAPRLHSREILAERARREGSRLLLLSATPSVETWWRAAERRWALRGIARPAWPEVLTADTRGILRHHPLTLPLTRALTEVPRRGRPVALVVSREASALGCEECASVLRCGGCGVALAFSRQPAGLACRLCGRQEAPPEACPACRGRRLGPVGWSAERVEAAVRRRFPALSVARWRRGPAPQAQVLIGTPALLRALPPGGASAVGFVALDAFLRVPDFRGAERALAHLWTAAEATGPRGRVVVQTLHPDHYAVRAAVTGDRSAFYDPELAFRQELGYPPFRRLAAVSVTGGREAVVRELAQECARSLTGVAGLTVYPPAPRGPGGARRSRWRFVVKGPDDLPALLAGPLAPRLQRRRERGAVVEVEMDPLALG